MTIKTHWAKTFSFFVFGIMLISSCAKPTYKFQSTEGETLDFSSGTWLLLPVESNGERYLDKMDEMAYEEFRKLLGDSLANIDQARNKYLVSPPNSITPRPDYLKELSTQTEFDFVIFIRSLIIADEIGGLVTQDGPTRSAITETVVEIYELKNLTRISEQQVRSTLVDSPSLLDEGSTRLAESPESSKVNALRKLIRRYGRKKLD